MPPGLGVVESPVAGQLVSLLTVLASALAVPLAGECADAAQRTCRQAERQRDVDVRQRIPYALRLLLGTPRRDHHGARCASQGVCGLDDVALGNAGERLHAFGPIGRGDTADLVEALGARVHKRLIDEPVADEDVEQAVGERRVRARADRQMPRRPCGRRRAPGVDDDERAACGLLRLEVLHDRRHRLGRVAANEQHDPGARDVVERERQPAVDAERTLQGAGGRRHAESPVVVDVGRPQCHACELADQVRLLVGQRAAAEHADGVPSVTRLHVADTTGDQGERLVPARLDEQAARRSDERRGEPIRVPERRGRRPPFDTQSALVDRKPEVA